MCLICRKIKGFTIMSMKVLMNMFSKIAQALQYVLTDKANELAKKTASSGAAAKSPAQILSRACYLPGYKTTRLPLKASPGPVTAMA
jgi:hypothetical protein